MFIDGNNLKERFSNLDKDSEFSIGEIGFGIGLNFLTTCKVWLDYSSEDQNLVFYSFDKNIFKLEDFKEVLNTHSELKQYSNEFQNYYPNNVEGLQRISLFEGRIKLNLLIGDIKETQSYLSLINSVDAWYLDGFSPAKNPELWSEELFNNIHQTCHTDTTFSTYTSSGFVKDNLRKTDFKFTKTDGFSSKRHMLKGNAISTSKKNKNSTKKVAVIGSGLAGCMLSYTLAKKGIEVDLFEKSETICSAASSHELLVTYPRLSAHDTAYGRFNLQSYLYATAFYDELSSDAWKKTGVLVLNHDDDSEKRQASLLDKRSDGLIYKYLDAKNASEISGIETQLNGLLYDQAGYILPREMCQTLIESNNINLITSAEIKDLEKIEDKITFKIDKLSYEYEQVCLCTGSDTNNLMKLPGFNIKRGQVSHVKSNESLSGIKLPICAKGYISPKQDKLHLLGSSYSDLDHLRVIEEEHNSNIEKLKIIIDQDPEIYSGRAGFRAVSKDHMPIVGEKNGLYINTCHGSRASVTTPISAELIANLILDMAPPLEEREVNSLSPKRFS